MKKVVLCLSILVAFNVVINAQNAKVGFVNQYYIFKKVVEKELKGWEASKVNEVNQMIERYKRESKYLRENANSMSEDTRRSKVDELMQLQTQIKRKTEDYQRAINARRNRLEKNVSGRIFDLSRKIAAEDGLDLVFTSGSAPIFKSDRITVVNITNEVLRRIEAREF